MKTLAQALSLLVKRRVMTLAGAGTGAVPSLASEVAGEPVRGSWWGHPKGRLIFKIAGELEDHRDVLVTRLVGDKVTFVHRALWPALYRVATDTAHVREVLAAASPRAGRLYAAVQKAGSLRLDKSDKKAAAELDDLVLTAQEHGEKGAHETVLRAWNDWATKDIRAAAKRIPLESARATLAAAVES